MLLSLVIPFYNEEESAKRVVGDLSSALDGAALDYELILVNNGSVDATPQILNALAKEKPHRLKVVNVPVNQGYGWGIINGLKTASGEFIGHMCGDGQIKPQDVIRVVDMLQSGDYDLVKVKRTVRRDRIIRRVLSKSYNLLFMVVFNVGTLDVDVSPKILKKESLARISPESKDWFIDPEIMIKAKYLGLRMAEVPVEFLDRERGKSHVALATIGEFARNMLDYKFGGALREWKTGVSRS